MKVMIMNIYNKLKLARYNLNWSILDLAEKAKVSRSTILAYENDKVDLRLSTFFKLCDALHLKILI